MRTDLNHSQFIEFVGTGPNKSNSEKHDDDGDQSSQKNECARDRFKTAVNVATWYDHVRLRGGGDRQDEGSQPVLESVMIRDANQAV